MTTQRKPFNQQSMVAATETTNTNADGARNDAPHDDGDDNDDGNGNDDNWEQHHMSVHDDGASWMALEEDAQVWKQLEEHYAHGTDCGQFLNGCG